MATASAEPGDKENRRRRFKSPFSDKEIEEISKGFVPLNTRKNTNWACNVFLEWKAERNASETSNLCPKDLLDNPEPELLNYWLCRFVSEVRNQKGKPYPPKTVHQLLSGLQRSMMEKNPSSPKFLDRNNVAFRELHRSCDAIYRDLHHQGFGASVSHAVPFTCDEEELLWSRGILSDSTPKGLQRAVFFMLGSIFVSEEEQSNVH